MNRYFASLLLAAALTSPASANMYDGGSTRAFAFQSTNGEPAADLPDLFAGKTFLGIHSLASAAIDGDFGFGSEQGMWQNLTRIPPGFEPGHPGSSFTHFGNRNGSLDSGQMPDGRWVFDWNAASRNRWVIFDTGTADHSTDPTIDHNGNGTLIVTPPVAVPDSAGTFGLLALTLAGLAFVRRVTVGAPA